MDAEPPTRPSTAWAPPAQAGPVPAVPSASEPRIGASERNVAEQRLRDALRDDVITISEYDERLGQVLAARTQVELDVVLADLPARTPPTTRPLQENPRIIAVLGTSEQRGRWRPASRLPAIAVLGTAKVDLRDAVSDDGVFSVNANAFLGTVEVIVADDATVELNGISILGARQDLTPSLPGAGPTVRVTGYALLGEIKVRPATKRERRRFPVAGQTSAPPADGPAGPTTASRGWGRRLGAVAVIALLGLGPVRAAATADAVALFGSREYQPTNSELAGEDEIKVASFFGSIEVVLPDGVAARTGGFQLFGSLSCERPCQTGSELPPVDVDASTMFGSVEIRSVSEE